MSASLSLANMSALVEVAAQTYLLMKVKLLLLLSKDGVLKIGASGDLGPTENDSFFAVWTSKVLSNNSLVFSASSPLSILFSLSVSAAELTSVPGTSLNAIY